MSTIPLDPEACRALVASERWQRRITVTESGCWLIAYYTGNHGYVGVRLSGRLSLVHRVALVAHLGRDLLPGMQADHLCHNRAYAAGDCAATADDPCAHRRCVNPEHLAEHTARENLLAGGTIAADHAARTHCPQGHSLTGPEADLTSTGLRRGERQCRRCDRARRAAIRRAARGLRLAQRAYYALFGQSRATAETILATLADGRDPASIVRGAQIALEAAEREGIAEWLEGLRGDLDGGAA